MPTLQVDYKVDLQVDEQLHMIPLQVVLLVLQSAVLPLVPLLNR